MARLVEVSGERSGPLREVRQRSPTVPGGSTGTLSGRIPPGRADRHLQDRRTEEEVGRITRQGSSACAESCTTVPPVRLGDSRAGIDVPRSAECHDIWEFGGVRGAGLRSQVSGLGYQCQVSGVSVWL